MTPSPAELATRRTLAADLTRLGVEAGDTVMVHAGLRSVGPVLGGPDALICAVLDAAAPGGTLMVYTDCADWDEHGLVEGPGAAVDPNLRADIPPFDPQATRARRANGALSELVRTTPGALRSESPGPSCAALGARAAWLTVGHALDYGYGEESPFAKLVEADGKVVLVGAPLDSMTLLHHAEHLARIPGKRVVTYELPLKTPDGIQWRRVEEFDTSDPVVAGLEDRYFARVVEGFLATGQGARGRIGQADAVLVPARAMVAFAVSWLEARFAA